MWVAWRESKQLGLALLKESGVDTAQLADNLRRKKDDGIEIRIKKKASSSLRMALDDFNKGGVMLAPDKFWSHKVLFFLRDLVPMWFRTRWPLNELGWYWQKDEIERADKKAKEWAKNIKWE